MKAYWEKWQKMLSYFSTTIISNKQWKLSWVNKICSILFYWLNLIVFTVWSGCHYLCFIACKIVNAFVRRVFVGDVVVMKDPEKSDNYLVRRLAAVEGYEMASKDEKDEPFVLEKDQYWVLADNDKLKPKVPCKRHSLCLTFEKKSTWSLEIHLSCIFWYINIAC